MAINVSDYLEKNLAGKIGSCDIFNVIAINEQVRDFA